MLGVLCQLQRYHLRWLQVSNMHVAFLILLSRNLSVVDRIEK